MIMNMNMIEIEDGVVFGRFPAGTLVRIVGQPEAPGRGCRSQRCQEFVLPDTASYGIDVGEDGEYQVVRADVPFGVSTIGPWCQALGCSANCGDAVGAILDDMIDHWRARVGHIHGARLYVDALQWARKNILGKEKP